MRITLEVTSKPMQGKKFHLRAGQVARFGKTEWADYSLPKDSQLSDVHFSLDCTTDACRLQDLESESGTMLNGEPITVAVVKHGDEISAGATTLSVVIDRDGEDVLAGTDDGSVTANKAQDDPTDPAKVMDAVELAQYLELDEDAHAIATPDQTAEEFLDVLKSDELFVAAIRVQAHLLEKKRAISWAYLCTYKLFAAESAATPVFEAIRNWVDESTDENRRQANNAAETAGYDFAPSMIGMAVFWSEGSLSEPDLPEVLPDERLTGQAVMGALVMAAYHDDPLKAEEQFRQFLATAKELPDGEISLTN